MAEITSAIIKSLITDDNGTEKYVYPKTVADAVIMDSEGTNLTTAMNNMQNAIDNINITGGGTITLDEELSDTSKNPVQNKVIKAAIDDIVDGTTVVGKATADANGNIIHETYVTEERVSEMIGDSSSGSSDGGTSTGDADTLGGNSPDYYASKTYVAEQIAGANHLTREIVTEIPTVDTAKDNVIYMYQVDSATGSDVYQEYQLINGEIVLVGDTSVDLSGYATSDELDDYLPLTGGKITGAMEFGNVVLVNNSSTEGGEIQLALPPSNTLFTDNVHIDVLDNRIRIHSTHNGEYKCYNISFNELLAGNNSAIHTGNVGSYALPISGGILSSNQITPLEIKSTMSTASGSFIRFSDETETLGHIGFNAVNDPTFSTVVGVRHTLHHDGNSAKSVVVDTDPGVGATVDYADGTLLFVKKTS